MKRVWIALWALSLPVVLAFAVFRSTRSIVNIYNDTGMPLDSLTVVACGETFRLNPLDSEGTVRVRMPRDGEASSVRVRSSDPLIFAERGYIKPNGGYRVTIYLKPDFSLDYDEQRSFWLSLFD